MLLLYYNDDQDMSHGLRTKGTMASQGRWRRIIAWHAHGGVLRAASKPL